MVCQQVHITSFWCFESRELEKEDREQRGADAHISEFALALLEFSPGSANCESRPQSSIIRRFSQACISASSCVVVWVVRVIVSRADSQASTGYVTDKLGNIRSSTAIDQLGRFLLSRSGARQRIRHAGCRHRIVLLPSQPQLHQRHQHCTLLLVSYWHGVGVGVAC